MKTNSLWDKRTGGENGEWLRTAGVLAELCHAEQGQRQKWSVRACVCTCVHERACVHTCVCVCAHASANRLQTWRGGRNEYLSVGAAGLKEAGLGKGDTVTCWQLGALPEACGLSGEQRGVKECKQVLPGKWEGQEMFFLLCIGCGI